MAQLRAATNLARLMRDQGKRKKASALPVPIYNWFLEKPELCLSNWPGEPGRQIVLGASSNFDVLRGAAGFGGTGGGRGSWENGAALPVIADVSEPWPQRGSRAAANRSANAPMPIEKML